MLKKITPFLALTLLVGLLYSCGGSSNPLVSEAKSNVKGQNYEAALQAANKSIEQYPQDAAGYYYKGVALAGIAESKPAGERKSYYEQMNKAFAKAKEIANQSEEPPSEIQNIPAVKTSEWRTEHNAAIGYATNDSIKATVSNPLQVAISHLQNATVIEPDSLLSWDVLARVYGMDKDYKKAADAMQVVINKKPKPTTNQYLVLSQYLQESGDKQGVVNVLEKAQQTYPDSVDVVQRLADAYQNIGEIDKSMSVVQKLINQDPSNPQYHLVLGTLVYQQVLELNSQIKDTYSKIDKLKNELNSASGQQATDLKNQIAGLESQASKTQDRIDDLSNTAEKELLDVVKYRPDDDNAYNTLGIIYQNKAAAVYEQRNRTTDNAKAAELDKQARNLLMQSMKYYEKAAQINPDKKSYWKSLFSVYTTLGMDKKAEEAMKKAGLDN